MVKLDFSWGNPYFLLEILDSEYRQTLAPYNIKKMSYAPDIGMEKLVKMTREVIKHTSGLEYKYVIITNGATQAISSILKYYRHGGRKDFVITNEFTFPFYPDMIKNCGLRHVKAEDPFNRRIPLGYAGSPVWLIDSPSNPEGKVFKTDPISGGYKDVIWDAVYHNRIYSNRLSEWPFHEIMVGSYSKLLGVTGARIGFIATDNDFLAQNLTNYSLIDTATISVPSQSMIIDILSNIDLDIFMNLGRRSLDLNRENFQKIEYLFDGQEVKDIGMFYFVKPEKKALEILDDAGVSYVKMRDHIRLSMGQTNQVTEKGIQAILKRDGK